MYVAVVCNNHKFIAREMASSRFGLLKLRWYKCISGTKRQVKHTTQNKTGMTNRGMVWIHTCTCTLVRSCIYCLIGLLIDLLID